MQFKKYKYIYFLLFLTQISCEQINDIQYDIPFEGEKTVLYGFLSSTDSSVIQVYKTQSVLTENPDFTIENAEVNVISDEVVLQTFTVDNSTSIVKYYHSYDIQNDYSIEVTRNGELSESGIIKIMPVVGIDSLSYLLSDDEKALDLNLYFTDTQGNSYYSYSIEKYSQGERILESGRTSINEKYLNVISDVDFKNLSKKITFQDEDLEVFRLDENNNFIGVVDIDSIAVNLFTLTEEFFLRRKSEADNDEADIGRTNSNNELIWSNISNGYGFVGGVSKNTLSITF